MLVCVPDNAIDYKSKKIHLSIIAIGRCSRILLDYYLSLSNSVKPKRISFVDSKEKGYLYLPVRLGHFASFGVFCYYLIFGDDTAFASTMKSYVARANGICVIESPGKSLCSLARTAGKSVDRSIPTYISGDSQLAIEWESITNERPVVTTPYGTSNLIHGLKALTKVALHRLHSLI